MPGTVTASDACGVRTLVLSAGERNLLDPATMALLHGALVAAAFERFASMFTESS